MSITRDNAENSSQDDADRAAGIYQAAAAERVPARLDDRVLEVARLEAVKGQWFGWMVPWLRPATFALTIGLSLAVLLELRELSTPANGLVEPGAPAHLPPDVVNEFTSAAQDSADRMLSIGDSAAARDLQGDRLAKEFTAGTGIDGVEETAYCDAEQTATPEAWQRCIRALRQDGRDTAVSREIRRFREAYPDSPTPPD